MVCIAGSDDLTEETAEQIEKNNEAGGAMCGQQWARCKKAVKRKPSAVRPAPQSKPAAKPSPAPVPATPLRPSYADDGEPKMI